MSQVYQTRRKMERETGASAREMRPQGPDLSQLQGGAMPTAEQLGRRVDLPGSIRAKMEASFGADLSRVELYESQTVADAGAQAMAMGNKIGFAPGQLDFASSGGQALLGHELSHVVSQARGEVTGNGFLNDHALEARADREGALAAAGESVYSGPVAPISTTSTALSAAGPMQAKKPGRKKGKNAPAANTPAATAPATPDERQFVDLEEYFPAIHAKRDVLTQVQSARKQQQNAAQAYAVSNNMMKDSQEITSTSGGRQFLSLFRPGDDRYNEALSQLWRPDGGLNTELSEEKMMEYYNTVSSPLYQELMDLDLDTLGTDEDSVRYNFARNNELVGRLNSLTDIRTAMAGHLTPRGEGEEKSAYDARVKDKKESIFRSAMQTQGHDAAAVTQKFSEPGGRGKAMQKAMGIQGRLDVAYRNMMSGNNDVEQGANLEFDALRGQLHPTALSAPRDFSTYSEEQKRNMSRVENFDYWTQQLRKNPDSEFVKMMLKNYSPRRF